MCKPGLNYIGAVHRVIALVPEELLEGPHTLGVSFEFWENLVLRYFKDPNRHDLVLQKAIDFGPGGLSLEEFTKREIIYLSLTSVLKREEIRFFEECERSGFDPYSERNWGDSQAYPYRRFGYPDYRLVNDRTELYKFANGLTCREVNAEIGQSDCAYHEPKLFRHNHRISEALTLDCCRGITTRRLGAHLDTSFHLSWIAEYAAACELCQTEADEAIRVFARRGLTFRHRPRFHPAYFIYTRVPYPLEQRDIRYLYFFSNLEARLQEGSLEREEDDNWESRPTRSVIFSFIIEYRFLELREALVENVKPTGPLEPYSKQGEDIFEECPVNHVIAEVAITYSTLGSPAQGKTKRGRSRRSKNKVGRSSSGLGLRRSPRLNTP